MGSARGALKATATRLGLSWEAYQAQIDNGLKWCGRCKTWQPRVSFGIDGTRGDGLSSHCLQSGRVLVRRTRKGMAPAIKGRRHTPEALAKMSAAHKGERNWNWKGGISLHRKRDPAHLKARQAANNDVRLQRIPRPDALPCVDCGARAQEYDHYLGYAEEHWLDLQAVCLPCHHKREVCA